MFQKKTLFVVGAGASQEAGLPTGKELKRNIASKLCFEIDFWKLTAGDHEIADALRQHVKDTGDDRCDIGPHLDAGRQISSAMVQAISVDHFIDAHQGDERIELCGKLAIVKSILEAEQSSLLFTNATDKIPIDFNKIQVTWYTKLLQRLAEQRPKKEIERVFENVAIITFNYDRCIEHFLYGALQNFYGITSTESGEALKTLTIFHPYGTVGNLPWQGNRQAIPFGSHHQHSGQLLSLAAQIKTFTERIEDEPALSAMRNLVREAHTIVFLGFAFHPQNMELIGPDERTNVVRVFSTTKGISDSDCAVVRQHIAHAIKKKEADAQFHMRPGLTCSGLFSEYWRSLTI